MVDLIVMAKVVVFFFILLWLLRCFDHDSPMLQFATLLQPTIVFKGGGSQIIFFFVIGDFSDSVNLVLPHF